MLSPTPTPYRNIGRDVENEDLNAAHLQMGVEDARARLKAASQQYHATPAVPQEQIYNKASQDLIDRINAVENAKTRARELELKAKPTPIPSKIKTKDSIENGQPTVEFPGMDVSQQPTEKSPLQHILDAFIPPVEAATNSKTTNAPDFHAPMAAPVVPAQRAAQAVQTIRNSGVGQTGDKAIVDEKNTAKTTTTNPLLLDANDIDTVGSAIRGTPEWQRQSRGLDDLEYLTGLEAQRNANKFSADLSPLGAYLDYQNTLHGKPTNLEKGLHMAPLEDTSLKDMGEIQRRRADMAKELINTIKASKVGQIVTQDGQVVGYTGGVQIPKPNNPTSNANLGMRAIQNLKKASDAAFKDNDEQYKTLNSLIERVKGNNSADIGAIPAILEVADTGSKRILAGILGMEKYDPSIAGSLGQWFSTNFKGKLSEHSQQVLMTRLQAALERARQERGAKEAEVRQYAKSLPVQPSDVENIVGAHAKMPGKGYPTASGSGKNNPDDEKAHMKMFLDMINAHEAGK